MRIPKKIKVGPMRYKVLYPHTFIEDSSYFGLHDGCSSIIKISDTENDTIRNPLCIVETLLHECIHAIDFVFVGQKLEEKTVEKFSEHLLQVFVDNDINLYDNDIMPETVIVSGFTYKVIFPHTFVDTADDIASSINRPKLKFYISGEENGEIHSNMFIKMNLFYMILCSILRLNCFNGGEIDFDLKTLSVGLLQVFVENKLTELIKDAKKENMG